jgi:hypothetical protein
MRFGLCVGLLVLSQAACKRSPSTEARPTPTDDAGVGDAGVDLRPEMVVLERVELDTLGPIEHVEEAERSIALEMARALIESGQFVAKREHVPATHRPRSAHLEMTITYDLLTHPSGARAIMTAAQARLVWADGGDDSAPWEKLVVEHDLGEAGPAPGRELDAAMAIQVGATGRAALDGIVLKERVRTADAAQVAAALEREGQSGEAVLWALEMVRERRLVGAVDEVVRLLKSGDRDVRETAIGVLMVLGDPRAVAPIADATDTADPVAVRIAIDAAATLGGEDARTFLEFLRDHPSESIGDQAARALEKLGAAANLADGARP